MPISFQPISPPDSVLTCAVALLLDFCIGDPRGFPHPVKGIGWLVKKLEHHLYGPGHRLLSGCVLLVCMVCIVCGCVYLALRGAGAIGRYMQLGAAAVLIWTALAVRDLFDHAERVRSALKRGDIATARLMLAAMVSRDTANLQEHEIARGCIESVAENLVDGVISPLFFALIGGPVPAYAFKTISTLDSMVGYRSQRYREFGWASARADDLLNFVPARLLFVILPLAAMVVRDDVLKCVTSMFRDGNKNPSVNSGIPESGFAGALGIQLGGANMYAGAVILKPYLNEEGRRATIDDIRQAQILLCAASIVSFCFLSVVLWLVRYL